MKRGSARDEGRQRLREAEYVERTGQKNKTRSEGGKKKSQAEESCSAVGGAVWFLWPGPTSR